VVLAPLPLEIKVILALILFLLAGTLVPNRTEELARFVSLIKNPVIEEPREKKRIRILSYHASESNDPRLLLPLFEVMDRANFAVLQRPLSKLLRNLVPGDVIYSSARLLSFLRGVVYAQLMQGNKSRYDPTFTESAIYALGVLQDVKAHGILLRLSQSDDHRHAPYLSVTLDALRRINDAKAWLGASHSKTRKSRRR
jgi:hypothetical protein